MIISPERRRIDTRILRTTKRTAGLHLGMEVIDRGFGPLSSFLLAYGSLKNSGVRGTIHIGAGKHAKPLPSSLASGIKRPRYKQQDLAYLILRLVALLGDIDSGI